VAIQRRDHIVHRGEDNRVLDDVRHNGAKGKAPHEGKVVFDPRPHAQEQVGAELGDHDVGALEDLCPPSKDVHLAALSVDLDDAPAVDAFGIDDFVERRALDRDGPAAALTEPIKVSPRTR
jgi:hypothetical protein